jgi:dipeptidyl aminopeptidase/acylaminoacyl peptidase
MTGTMPTLTPERLVYDLRSASDPRLSPDGSRIAWVVNQNARESPRQRSEIWMCDADGGNARRITTGHASSSPRWSPDGARLAFVSTRDGMTGIWLLEEGIGEARLLTAHRVPVGGLAWSPDGARLAYIANSDPDNPEETPAPDDAPPPIRVARRGDYKQDDDARGWVGDTRAQVWIVDAASGERRRLTSDPVDHASPQWSPDGSAIAVTEFRQSGFSSRIAVLDAGTGAVRCLIGPEHGVVGTRSWSPDGTRILYAGEEVRTWQCDWRIADAATGDSRLVTSDHGIDVASPWSIYGDLPAPCWIDGERVIFPGERAAASGLWSMDVETGSVRPLHHADIQFTGFSHDRAGARIAVVSTSHDHIAEVAVIDTGTGTYRRVTDLNGPVLRESPLARSERFWIERGGMTIDAWLLFPPDYDPSIRYPVVMDIHGGPNWYYGYDFSNVQQALAAAGNIVVYANPRGSTTYGREFTMAVRQDWGGEDFLDLMAVMDTVCARPDVDPTRTGVYGYSYGGFMSSWIIGHTDRFTAAVIGAPVVDLVSFFGTSDIATSWGPSQFGATPWERPEWYREHSPVTWLDRATTPSLILHGEGDERCPIGQGEQLFAALREAGVETEFVRYPGMTHLFPWGGEPVYIEDFLTRIVRWFGDRL